MKKECEHCKEEFESHHWRTKYCCDSCKTMAYLKRHPGKQQELYEKSKKTWRPEWQKEHYKNNKEEILKRNSEWRSRAQRNGIRIYEGIVERCRNKNSPKAHLYANKGIKCLLTLDEFLVIYWSTHNCKLCNIKLQDEDRRKTDGRTIDRIDSDKHYSKENVRVLCKGCNSRLGAFKKNEIYGNGKKRT